ncbi:hypothetical protein RHRU231_820170 [Rhodococcus ruber]|uniref:Uncharacterized protein n=1 Tax=Rhodococcus ruber TaxID=1830 RepID=A0A098BT58_9NOCA|nr:hypothetical protein RHRU231_820170 [Rhodococcus ruber]
MYFARIGPLMVYSPPPAPGRVVVSSTEAPGSVFSAPVAPSTADSAADVARSTADSAALVTPATASSALVPSSLLQPARTSPAAAAAAATVAVRRARLFMASSSEIGHRCLDASEWPRAPGGFRPDLPAALRRTPASALVVAVTPAPRPDVTVAQRSSLRGPRLRESSAHRAGGIPCDGRERP